MYPIRGNVAMSIKWAFPVNYSVNNYQPSQSSGTDVDKGIAGNGLDKYSIALVNITVLSFHLPRIVLH